MFGYLHIDEIFVTIAEIFLLQLQKFHFTFSKLCGNVFTLSRSGGTADALASGASGSNIVWVQIPSPAYYEWIGIPIHSVF